MGSGLQNDMPLAGASHDDDHVESDGSCHVAVSMWLADQIRRRLVSKRRDNAPYFEG
jgi:isopentenyldiphosphate isomerase